MRKEIRPFYKKMIGEYDNWEMPILKDILTELDIGGWKIKSGELLYDDTSHKHFLIIAKHKSPKHYRFKSLTRFF